MWKNENQKVVAQVAIGIAAIVLLFCLENADKITQFAVFLPVYVLLGASVFKDAFADFKNGKFLRESFLMAAATLGAAVLGEFSESLAVLVFYTLGEFLEDKATDHSKKTLAALAGLKSDTARVVEDGVEKIVDSNKVKIGAVVRINAFEKIPLDSELLNDEVWLDTRALTGESAPRRILKGGELLAGAINGEKSILAKTLRPLSESSVAKILKLVTDAREKKAQFEKFITRFAGIYTPFVVFSALFIGIFPPLFFSANFSEWIFRALVLLVVSCPCAFMIGVPLVYFCAIGRASKLGIVIKGGVFVDILAKTQFVVFDKTGTLTHGNFALQKMAITENSTISAENLLKLAAATEKGSSHPIAKSIVDFVQTIDSFEKIDTTEIRGKGIRARIDSQEILIGTLDFLKESGVKIPEKSPKTFAWNGNSWEESTEESWDSFNVLMAINGVLQGAFFCEDQVRESAAPLLESLNKSKIHTAILSGDTESRVRFLADKLGIANFKAALLPEEKVAAFQKIAAGKTAIFVGDGINDSPVLAAADAGVSLGGSGSAAALENADVVLMNDSLTSLAAAIALAKSSRRILWQNVALALGVKFAALALGALGLLSMWLAIFADTGVTLLVVLNALRIFKFNQKSPTPQPAQIFYKKICG